MTNEENNKALLNLEYYYALYYLQEGFYEEAKKHLKNFMNNINKSTPILAVTTVHYGKVLFYLGKYQQSLEIWNNFKKEARDTSLPQDILNYHNASIAWREYILNSSGLVQNYNHQIGEDLLDNAVKVGASQMKNVYFSKGYSKYLNKDYVKSLKEELRKNFRQPMFMVAALFLEAKALLKLDRNNKKLGGMIIQSLNQLDINWNSQLFMNHISRDNYFNLSQQIRISNISEDIVVESADYRKNNADFKYILNHFS